MKMDISELYEHFLACPLVTTDSRTCPAGSIFFALKGEKFDGNCYAQKALDSGCAYAVVDEAQYIPEGDNRYVLVADALQALQQLANMHRRHFHHPVIQITGTNGKTTTKELTAAVLSKKYQVLATEANYNNHIGVPKTLLRLTDRHNMAVIETGASHPGEIRELAGIVDPDYGLITNVGRAHLEGFGSFEGVVKTKGELYDYLRQKEGSQVFIHGDNPYLANISAGLKLVKYGEPGHEDYLVEGEALESDTPYLTGRWRKAGEAEWHRVETRLIGSYNIYNVLAAACIGTFFGVGAEQINNAIEEYVPKNDRSELRVTAHNELIVDAYNANPTSMRAALLNFMEMKGNDKMAILGDMGELGTASEEEHQKIVDLLKQSDVETVWLVGGNFKKARHTFRTFDNVEEVKEELHRNPVKGKCILIKGSNRTRLYQLPDFL